MRKVGIVGADIGQDDLIEQGKGWELWSCNNLYKGFPDVKFSRWYELHTIEREGQKYKRRGISYYPISSDQEVRWYLQEIDELKIPTFMQKKWSIIKHSKEFPFDKIREKWGDYFGCSFTWMLAQAIMEGADEIALFGMNFGAQEYYYQRPSLEYMIGIARGMGIPVTIGLESQLLKAPYIYAIGEDTDLIYMLHGHFATDVAMMVTTGLQERLTRYFYNPYWRRDDK
jgi:hypothetical protein